MEGIDLTFRKKNIIKLQNRQFIFSHVKQIGNSVAHYLARSSKIGSVVQVWHDLVPDDIAPLVTRNSL